MTDFGYLRTKIRDANRNSACTGNCVFKATGSFKPRDEYN